MCRRLRVSEEAGPCPRDLCCRHRASVSPGPGLPTHSVIISDPLDCRPSRQGARVACYTPKVPNAEEAPSGWAWGWVSDPGLTLCGLPWPPFQPLMCQCAHVEDLGAHPLLTKPFFEWRLLETSLGQHSRAPQAPPPRGGVRATQGSHVNEGPPEHPGALTLSSQPFVCPSPKRWQFPIRLSPAHSVEGHSSRGPKG